jgi:hypothetical protein
MQFTLTNCITRSFLLRGVPIAMPLFAGLASPALAQRDARAPAVTQTFDPAECRADCAIDSLSLDIDRGRRAQAGAVTLSLVLIDTVALARRGAPPAPRERPVQLWMSCDSTPCGAGVVPGRISDKRIDDARVTRRTQLAWALPAALVHRLSRASGVIVHAEGRAHTLAAPTVTATRALLEPVRASVASAVYSPRALLYVATFAAFGVPGDSAMAEDVGTATEPLMIPDATTTPPTRVATLTVVGRGASAVPMLVQDDGTGAAPIFGVGESVAIALPGRTGRRGVVSGRVAARQRVEALRDTCQKMKVWTYLVTMSAADLAATQRGQITSPRPGELIDRWNGTAGREPVAIRVAPAEQRSIAGSRSVVTQFVKERAASGIRERDVQVLAALPRGTGFVTNFGVLARDGGGNWRFPPFSLRPASCPAN